MGSGSGTWNCEELILQAGACLVRAEDVLTDYPEEISSYYNHVFSWIFKNMKIDNCGDQLNSAYRYCCNKDLEFITTTSKVNGLWDTLKN